MTSSGASWEGVACPWCGLLASQSPNGFICMTCDLDLDVDEYLSRLEELGPGEPLNRLRQLPKPAPLETVEELLRDLADHLAGQDRLKVAMAREQAIEALDDKVRSPAQLIDAALRSGAGGGPKAAGGSLGLEAPEPWPEPVDGAELLDELSLTFGRFLSLPKGARTALSLWVLFAHAHDLFHVSPLLVLSSPEKRCGKTTALTLIQALVPKALTASNITASAMFRAVELYSPTLLVDEADSFLRNQDELRGILNSGHMRSGAFVIRTVGEDHEPRRFRTWAPKAIALIGRLPSTLQDRAIVISMRRKMPGETVERLRPDRIETFAKPLRRRCARWVLDHSEELENADPGVPEQLHDRAADNWRPLLALADLVGGPWPRKARWAAPIVLAEEAGDDASIGVDLLADLRQFFEQTRLDRAFTQHLLDDLHEREDRPWGEWGRPGRPISPHTLARLLKPFGVRPKQIRIGETSKKGYLREDFMDAFARYLPAPEAKRPKQTSQDGGLRDRPERNGKESDSLEEAPPGPLATGAVSDVSLETAPKPQGEPPGRAS